MAVPLRRRRQITYSPSDLVRQAWLSYCLHKQFVVSVRNGEPAKIQRTDAGGDIRQRHEVRHEVLTVGTDIHRVVFDGVFVAA